MKIRFILALALASALVSCSGYWAGKNPVGAQEFGTVVNGDDGFCVALDENGAYNPAGMEDLLYRMSADEDGQRVIVAYYFDGETHTPGDLLNVYKVLTKDIFEMTPAAEDSIGNDRVEVSNAWISGNHVNVRFGYYGSGTKSHFINLVVPAEGDEMAAKFDELGCMYLEFRHNAFDDGWGYWYEDYASFPVDWDIDSYVGCYIGYTNYFGQKVFVELKNAMPEEI